MATRTTVNKSTPKTLLNKGTGFLSGYSHSLNPYTGCAFGCSYCYVRQMPVSLFRGAEWGTWVDAKQEAAALLRRELRKAKTKGPVTIFMSSSTDPYQPAEYNEQITRSLLTAMLDDPPDFLLVQTRSPLVSRDIDLLLHSRQHDRRNRSRGHLQTVFACGSADPGTAEGT
jgi:DNA repair photolyase